MPLPLPLVPLLPSAIPHLSHPIPSTRTDFREAEMRGLLPGEPIFATKKLKHGHHAFTAIAASSRRCVEQI